MSVAMPILSPGTQEQGIVEEKNLPHPVLALNLTSHCLPPLCALCQGLHFQKACFFQRTKVEEICLCSPPLFIIENPKLKKNQVGTHFHY